MADERPPLFFLWLCKEQCVLVLYRVIGPQGKWSKKNQQ